MFFALIIQIDYILFCVNNDIIVLTTLEEVGTVFFSNS